MRSTWRTRVSNDNSPSTRRRACPTIALVADGFEVHIPRGYIYFAMAFAAAVEVFNVIASRNRRKRKSAG